MPQLKILYTTTFPDNGGAEKLANAIARFYKSNNKFDIRFVSLFPSTRENNTRSQVFYLTHSNRTILAEALLNFSSFLSNFQPNTVHVFLGHSLNLLLAAIAKGSNKRVILHFIDPWFSFPYFKKQIGLLAADFINFRKTLPPSPKSEALSRLKPIENLLEKEFSCPKNVSKICDQILVCTDDIKEFLVKRLKISKSKIFVLPLYTEIIRPKNNLRIAKNLPLKVAYIGRVFDPWKGFWLLLEALKGLPRSRLFVFSNSPYDAFHINKIINFYRFPQNRLIFHYNLSDKLLRREIEKIPVVVISSLVEGFSFVMLEAMALGKIVVAGTLFGGPNRVIKAGENGFLFQPGDAQSLKEVLQKIATRKERTLVKISNSARKTALAYSKEKFFNRLTRIYETLGAS